MNENESCQDDVFARRNLLVRANLSMVRRAALWARRRLPVNIEFDDLYQSASLGLLEAAGRFDASFGLSFEAYAFKRVCGAALDPFRGRRYKDHTTLPLWTAETLVLPTGDQQLADRELRAVFARLLPALGSNERKVIVLRYWSGEDFNQIARRLRIGLSRAYKLHKDALGKLERELRRTIHIAVQGSGVIERLLL
jgi:RNA polymerase sigma factor (sigma-70 family)